MSADLGVIETDAQVSSSFSDLSVVGRSDGIQAVRKPRKSAVRVRLPEANDWPVLREIVQRHHARTVFADIPFSERKLDALEIQARNPKPHECLLVAEANGRPAGLAWVSAGEYLIGEGSLLTTTHLLAVDVDRCGKFAASRVFLRLVTGISIWSKSIGATSVLVHVTTGTAIKSTGRLLSLGGAKYLGGNYLVEAEGL